MSWNFALILFVLLVITGVIWGLDLALFRKRRERRAQAAAAQVDAAGITDAEQAGRERREAIDARAARPGGSSMRSASSR